MLPTTRPPRTAVYATATAVCDRPRCLAWLAVARGLGLLTDLVAVVCLFGGMGAYRIGCESDAREPVRLHVWVHSVRLVRLTTDSRVWTGFLPYFGSVTLQYDDAEDPVGSPASAGLAFDLRCPLTNRRLPIEVVRRELGMRLSLLVPKQVAWLCPAQLLDIVVDMRMVFAVDQDYLPVEIRRVYWSDEIGWERSTALVCVSGSCDAYKRSNVTTRGDKARVLLFSDDAGEATTTDSDDAVNLINCRSRPSQEEADGTRCCVIS